AAERHLVAFVYLLSRVGHEFAVNLGLALPHQFCGIPAAALATMGYVLVQRHRIIGCLCGLASFLFFFYGFPPAIIVFQVSPLCLAITALFFFVKVSRC